MTVRCFGGIAGSPSERTLSIRRSWSQSQAVHRLPLEGLRVPDGNPQHVLAQRQCDLANGEHETAEVSVPCTRPKPQVGRMAAITK